MKPRIRLSRPVAVALLVFIAGILWAAAPAVPLEAQIKYLSGTGPDDAVVWDFFCTGGRKSGVWSKIKVPSCWEQEGFGTYYYGTWRRGKPDDDPAIPKEQGKYRTEFTVPANWRGRHVRLVFEAVMTDTEVWINGRSAGPVHQGGFYRFHYDVASLVKYGATNLLEVTVSKESSNQSINLSERRGDYWTFGGIYRPVWLEARPAQFIDWTAIDARADGAFCAHVYLGTPLPGAQVAAQVFDADNRPVGAPLAATADAQGNLAIVRGTFNAVKSWTAETPSLYRVQFTLSEDGWPRHRIMERFGFRTLEVRPRDGVYLNGQKIVLKGIDRHCFWPETGRTLSRRQSYSDARLIKEANMNAVRMSHYPPDAYFLEACDELGLYALDELAGWQGFYDTAAGARLIGQMVRRDVNHPSILFWDNGNEGGWNTENDGEFNRWDLQQRPVLHPWEIFSGINTKHYPKYELMQQLSAGPEIFMPTEFLHGLYDGGIGAGLRDYWAVMSRSPTCAGGFFWVFADEGVVRTDQDGRIDCAGNAAPDGITGPHHEKEGSYYAVREVWSPVQITGQSDGVLKVENHYDFTNLSQCTFAWELARFPGPADKGRGHQILASGEVKGPAVAPRAAGELVLRLPDARKDADALFVTAKNPDGRAVWIWSWALKENIGALKQSASHAGPVTSRSEGDYLVVEAGSQTLRFHGRTGSIVSVSRRGKTISFGNGPRFVAYRRKEHNFTDLAGPARMTALTARPEGNAVIVEADYDGALRWVRWKILPDMVALDYEYAFDGTVDLLGVQLDCPEVNLKSKRWLGRGPYHVWQNRLQGGVLDVWETAYNDPVPGESWAYPEFRGYFGDWRWAVLETTEGSITVENAAGDCFLGVFTPRDGKVGPLLDLPVTGLAFLDVIPAIGEKFNLPETLGPQSQPRKVSGTRRDSLIFRFDMR